MSLKSDPTFNQTFIAIAIPVALQHLLSSLLNMLDVIMVGQLGDEAIAAVGLANEGFFILQLFLLGISGGASIFISQFWGKHDLSNARRIFGLSTIIGVLVSTVLSVAVFIFAKSVITIFTNDPVVISLGAKYLKITAVTYIMIAVTTCFASALRSTHIVKPPLYANATGIVLNTVLNYLLIFGTFGFPRLEVTGAAVATIVSRSVEMFFLLAVVYFRKYGIVFSLNDIFRINKTLVQRFINQTGTLVAKDLIWAFGITAYMIIYARISTEAIAAINIIETVRQIATVIFIGIANACLIMVGNTIGAKNDILAFNYAYRFLRLTVLAAIIIGLVIVASRDLVLMPFKVSQGVIDIADAILVIYGAFMVIFMCNMVFVVGIMRSGGDNRFCMFMDFVAVWLIGLPLALLGGFVWKLAVEWVFALIASQELFKAVLLFTRFIKRKWIHNLVHDIE